MYHSPPSLESVSGETLPVYTWAPQPRGTSYRTIQESTHLYALWPWPEFLKFESMGTSWDTSHRAARLHPGSFDHGSHVLQQMRPRLSTAQCTSGRAKSYSSQACIEVPLYQIYKDACMGSCLRRCWGVSVQEQPHQPNIMVSCSSEYSQCL